MARHHADRFTCPAIFASREGGAMTPVTAAKVKYGVWGLIGGAIIAALQAGASKAAICRTFGVKRTTLYETLKHRSAETRSYARQ